MVLLIGGCAQEPDREPLSAELPDVAAQVIVGGNRSASGGGAVGTVTRDNGSLGPTTSLVDLGRQLFFDTNLSEPPGQSCGTCHQEQAGFIDPRGGPTSRGAVTGRAGPRNTPSILYAAFIPALRRGEESYVGGLFLDGRANSLEEQAAAPFVNPIEMNNPSQAAVVAKVRSASYGGALGALFGTRVLTDDRAAFQAITQALAAFERDQRLARFTSKFDAYRAGRAQLSAAELRGLSLFNGKGNCAACHPSTSDPSSADPRPMFTDFTYDNIGIPKNPNNPFYRLSASFNPAGSSFVDRGLGSTLNDASEDGKFRVPTLRNIARTAPYGHNGYFATLRSIVDFYNSRDVGPWPPPEVTSTVNREELGDLRLTSQEIDDIVTFLNTLTDLP